MEKLKEEAWGQENNTEIVLTYLFEYFHNFFCKDNDFGNEKINIH